MEIKKPDLKVLLEKLSALRNYLNLVVPLIIAIVAGLMFIPAALLNAGLKAKIKTESLARGSTLDRMAEAPISKDQIQVEREYIKVYDEDANQIEQMAVQSTWRELLSYKIFPKPTDTSVLIFEEFGKRYRAGIEQKITQLRGRDAPSEAQLSEHLQTVQGRTGQMDQRMGAGMMTYGTRTPIPRGPGRPSTTGGAGDYGMGNPVIEQIIEAVCQERAQASGLYVTPTDVAGYNFWTDYRYDAGAEQAVTDCWYWQLGYWIVQDVFATIGACNAGSQNVLDAPVKRLMRVGFNRSMMGTDRGQYGGYRGMSGTSADGSQTEAKPQYVMTASTGLTPPCTGRLTQGDIHVVHFEVTVVVKAGTVMDFMKSLCSAKEHRFAGIDGQQAPQTFKHNQITVLESNVRAIDQNGSGPAGMGMYQYGMALGAGGMDRGGMGMGTASHQLYRYGRDAVMELNLICEYLFEKAGYEAVLPDIVKKALAGPEDPTNPMM